MKTELKTFTVAELTENAYSINPYTGEQEEFEDVNQIECGLYSMNGNLEIRPTWQREYIWREHSQKAFINSILKGWIINPIYLAVEKDIFGVPTGRFLMLDGQQRVTTLTKFMYDMLEVNYYGEQREKSRMSTEDQLKVENYPIYTFVIEYDDEQEMIEHFNTINQPTTVLTRQELRNATYNGMFVEDLKAKFGKRNCEVARHGLYSRYLNINNSEKVNANKIRIDRQEVVEMAILWTLVLENNELYENLRLVKDHSFKELNNDYIDKLICDYMKSHKEDSNCKGVWNNYVAIVQWIKDTFGTYHKEMANVKNWAYLYRKYHNEKLSACAIESRCEIMFEDILIHHKYNIPEYTLITETHPEMTAEEVLSVAKKLLSIDGFPEEIKKTVLAKLYDNTTGDYVCPECGKHYKKDEMEFHHIIAWTLYKGMDVNKLENCEALCHKCHLARHNMSDKDTVEVKKWM